MGTYFAPEALKRLKGQASVGHGLFRSMISTYWPSVLQPEAQGGEQLVSKLLELPYDVAVRIGKPGLLQLLFGMTADLKLHAPINPVPVKNTDHGHLRDGFVRAMLARMKIASSAGSLNDSDSEVRSL